MEQCKQKKHCFPFQELKGIYEVSLLPQGFKKPTSPVGRAKGLCGGPSSSFQPRPLVPWGNITFICSAVSMLFNLMGWGKFAASSDCSVRKKTIEHNNGPPQEPLPFIECLQVPDMSYLGHLMLKTWGRYLNSSPSQIRKVRLQRN